MIDVFAVYKNVCVYFYILTHLLICCVPSVRNIYNFWPCIPESIRIYLFLIDSVGLNNIGGGVKEYLLVEVYQI